MHLLAALVIGSAQAKPMDPCDIMSQQKLLAEASQLPSKKIRSIALSVQNAKDNRRQLSLQASDIKHVGEQIANSGTMNRGVYRVVLKNGQEAVLKISIFSKLSFNVPAPKGEIERLEGNLDTAFAIQNELAEVGIAPQIFGILERGEIEKLLPRLKKSASWVSLKGLEQSEVVGIVMDEVAGAWNILKEGHKVPGYVNEFSTRHWHQKVTAAKRALDSFQIQIVDEQLCASQDGTVRFLDLEYSLFLGRKKQKSQHADPLQNIQIEPSIEDYMDSIRDAKKGFP